MSKKKRTSKGTQVTPGKPCEICGESDWCLRSGDVAHCNRVSEPPSGWVRVRRHSGGCTSFRRGGSKLATDAPSGAVRQSADDTGLERPDPKWTRLAKRYAKKLTRQLLRRLARDLGVTAESLRCIGVGWHPTLNCYTFPHYDHLRRVVGIGTRYPDGRKRFIKGGHPGLHLPEGLEGMPDPVLIVEGPSDTAACLSMGLAAIGRPNNYGSEYLSDVIGDRDCIVVGDFDPKPSGRWPGREGAEKVAADLAAELNHPIRYALTPGGFKDIREWLAAQEIDL